MTTMRIYQLNDNHAEVRFESWEGMKRLDYIPNKRMYHEVWRETVEDIKAEDLYNFLETQFVRFNIDRPEEYREASMSVSDVIGIEKDGELEDAYFVDTIGFTKMPDWEPAKAYAAAERRAAEKRKYSRNH